MVAHLIIIGSVQGVGYRQFVKKNAQSFSLTGWVRNLPDGSVEAVLQGRQEIIEQMILLCRKGPFLARVADIQVNWEEETQTFSSFEILHE